MQLPLQVLDEICEFLTTFQVIQLSMIIKLSSHQTNKIQDRIQYIKDKFPSEIIHIFSFKSLLNGVDLPWNDDYLGITGYIDRIYPRHISYPLMTGVDNHNRPFIVVRTINNNEYGTQSIDVIFQRYSNNTKTWACAKSGYGFTQPHMNIMTNKDLQQNIIQLMNYDANLPIQLY
jgi:hypothetical protein